MNVRTTRRAAMAAAVIAAGIATAGTSQFALAATAPHEAESMRYGVVDPVDGTSWPKLIRDAAASGGKALHYGPNGVATKSVIMGDLSAITLRARGAQCEGAPTAKVTVDGTPVGAVSVASTKWADYRIAVNRPKGEHTIGVTFDNNKYVSSGTQKCNRDLFVDKFTLTTADSASADPAPSSTEPSDRALSGAGNPIWAGDAERALSSEWATGNAFDVNGGSGTSTLSSAWSNTTRVRRVTSPVAQGSSAFAMTVRAGDRDAYTSSAQRTEIGQNNAARSFPDGVDRQMYQGQERWIALQVRIPANYPSAAWNTLVQLKGEGSGNGPLSIYWENNRLALKKSGSQSYGSTNISSVWAPSVATPRDRWIQLLIHVKWSTSSDGFYELFGDLADGSGFRQLKSRTNGWTLKNGANGGPVRVGARFGIYRSAVAQDATAYFDGFNVAATRSDATLRAFGRSL